MVKKGLGPVKRFGARYGRTVKHKLAKIERELKGDQICSYCSSNRAKQVAVGIWYCKKCGTKFTGKAYNVGQKNRTNIITETKIAEETPVESVKNTSSEEVDA